MYEKYYQFERTPFSATPDPSFLYTSPAHREALAALIYGVQYRKGFIALIGEVGTGKTTVLRSYIHSKYAKNIKLIYVFNPKLDFSELLTVILREFTSEIPESEVEKADLLHRYLVAYYEKSINVVIVIDEAQNTPTDTLESMRMLSNIETTRHKMVQIILAGQPELEDLLSSHDLRQLRQRLSLTVRLRPLTREESVAYIQHRIKRAGVTTALFTPEALDWIVTHAEGIPRKINMICDNAFVTGFGAGATIIGIDILREIAADLRLQGIDAIDMEAMASGKEESRITSISIADHDSMLADSSAAVVGESEKVHHPDKVATVETTGKADSGGGASHYESAVNGASRWDSLKPDVSDTDDESDRVSDRVSDGAADGVADFIETVETTAKPVESSKSSTSSIPTVNSTVNPAESSSGESSQVVDDSESYEAIERFRSLDTFEEQTGDDMTASFESEPVPVLTEADERMSDAVDTGSTQSGEAEIEVSLTAAYLEADPVDNRLTPTLVPAAPTPRSAPSTSSSSGSTNESRVLILGDATTTSSESAAQDEKKNIESFHSLAELDLAPESEQQASQRSRQVQDAEHFFSHIDGLQPNSHTNSASFTEPSAAVNENNRTATPGSASESAESGNGSSTLSTLEEESDRSNEVDPVSYVLANRKKQSRTFKKFKKFW